MKDIWLMLRKIDAAAHKNYATDGAIVSLIIAGLLSGCSDQKQVDASESQLTPAIPRPTAMLETTRQPQATATPVSDQWLTPIPQVTLAPTAAVAGERTATPTIGPLSAFSQELIRKISQAGGEAAPEITGADYQEKTLIFRSGEEVNFVALTNLDKLYVNAPGVSRSKLRWPENDFYKPYRVQGYWLNDQGAGGHFGVDIGSRTRMLERSFPVRPVHPEAKLVLTTFNLPIGPEAGIFGFSGAIEAWYLIVDGAPYLFIYAHLDPSSVALTLGDASVNHGQVDGEPTTIGNTGATDGAHLHFQIIDAAKLLQLTGLGDPAAALLSLIDLNATPAPNDSESSSMQWLSIDPELFIPHPLSR